MIVYYPNPHPSNRFRFPFMLSTVAFTGRRLHPPLDRLNRPFRSKRLPSLAVVFIRLWIALTGRSDANGCLHWPSSSSASGSPSPAVQTQTVAFIGRRLHPPLDRLNRPFRSKRLPSLARCSSSWIALNPEILKLFL